MYSRNISAARTAPWAGSCPNSRTTRIPKTTAAIAALLIAPRHDGGLFSRSSRRCLAICLASPAVRGRPVRPARSIVPAGVPRCLRVRLFRVWAMALSTLLQRRQGFLQDVALGRESPQRNILGKALERGPRCQSDQLGLGDGRPRADAVDDLAEWHRPVVVHIGRDLRPPPLGQVEAERADPGKPGAVPLAQLGGDRLGELD